MATIAAEIKISPLYSIYRLSMMSAAVEAILPLLAGSKRFDLTEAQYISPTGFTLQTTKRHSLAYRLPKGIVLPSGHLVHATKGGAL